MWKSQLWIDYSTKGVSLQATFAAYLVLSFQESSHLAFLAFAFKLRLDNICGLLSFQESSPPCFCIQVFSTGTLKHLEKICNVCEGHLISMTFSPTNCEGYYAYSSRVEGKLCLLIDVITLSLLRRHKNPPIHKPRVGLVHDQFCIML